MRLTRRGRLTVTVAVTVLAVPAWGVRTAELDRPGPAGEDLRPAVGPPRAPQTAPQKPRGGPAGAGRERCTLNAAGKSLALSPGEAARAATAAADAARHNRGRGAIRAALEPQHPHPAALAAALSGHARAALSCRIDPPAGQPHQPGPSGLAPRAQRVRDELTETWGDLPLGGFAPDGVTQGHVPGSAHYDGRALDIFFRPATPDNQRRGWATTHWLVAHAHRLGITAVIYDRKIWSAQHADRGWRDYQHPDGPTDNPTLLHRDHIHVEVAGGEH